MNQEHDKVVQRVSPRVPVPIKSSAFVKNVSSSLNGVVIAWALEVFFWEKPDRHVIGNSSSGSSA